MAALAVVTLGGALLAGTFAAQTASRRSTHSRSAALVAQSEARIALASVSMTWSAALDSLAIGGSVTTIRAPRTGGIAALPVHTRTRVDRVSADIYLVAAESEVGSASPILARRRMRVVLKRPTISDSTAPLPSPAPIARWSVADIY